MTEILSDSLSLPVCVCVCVCVCVLVVHYQSLTEYLTNQTRLPDPVSGICPFLQMLGHLTFHSGHEIIVSHLSLSLSLSLSLVNWL